MESCVGRVRGYNWGPALEMSLAGDEQKPNGMYARCRNALQRANVSRRFLRRMPILIGLAVGVFLWTAVRLHSGSPLIPASIMRLGHQQEKPAPPPPPPLPGTDRPAWQPGLCNVPEIEFLRRSQLGLTSNVVYTRRCIKPLRSKSVDGDGIASFSHPLITARTTINLTECSGVELPPCEPITLEVPMPYPEGHYEHLLFGIASEYERIHNSLPEFSHWLSNTGAQLLAIVADAEDPNKNHNLTALEELYAQRNIKATFIPPTLKQRIGGEGPPPIEHHHFLLVRELHTHVTPGVTRWLGVLDDDTFFPALLPLDEELARHDHTKSTWLGALSDDFGSVRTWGMMAFGGAGIFLSPPLAAAVAPHADQCLRNQPTNTGDGLLRDCIYAHTRTQLTLIPGLNQQDMRGDPSGFFEGGLHPLSLHHWKSWFRAPVAAMARVATLVCGSCMLQRWRFGDDTVFTNGWSVAVYNAKTLAAIDLNRVEGTWDHATREYDPTYGMLRERVPRDKKRSYILRDAVEDTVDGGRVFRQAYVYRPEETWEDRTKPFGLDEVVELFWEL